MVKFILGRAGSGKTEWCLQQMTKKLSADPLGPGLFLLVPEHMTYTLERELSRRLQDKGSGFVRGSVFGFRRFAQQILAETGGAAVPRINELGKQLLLKKITSGFSEKLNFFQRAAKQRGFTASLAQLLDECRDYGVTANALAAAAAKVEDETLQAKFQDVSALYAAFSREMQGKYNDHEDMLEQLAAKIPASRQLENAEIWLDGFVFFNPQEKAVLKALLTKVSKIYLTLDMDAPGSRENEKETGIFARQHKTLQEVIQMLKEMQISYETEMLPSLPRYADSGLGAVEEALLHRRRGEISPEELQLVEAPNRRWEAEAAAVDIIRLCRENNYRYSDIGVMVRDEAYDDFLGLVFEDYKIPYFHDSKRKGVHHPLAELVRSAIGAVAGWRYEEMFRCLKTGFFDASRQQIDLLENYVLEFGIRGSRWYQEEAWQYRRGEGEYALPDEETLAKIDLLRQRVAAPLTHLQQALKEAADVQAMTLAIYDFLIELDVPGTLANWTEEAEKNGRLAEAREHEQIWQQIMELFEQFVELSGKEKISRRDYKAMLEDGLDALKLSLIPPGLDYVTITSFDQNSLDNLRAVYILGANDGTMPRQCTEQGLLSDADRLYLADCGIELSKGSLQNSFMERYLIYKAFTRAREYLWLSYPLADSEGSGLSASPLISQLRELLPGAAFRSLPLLEWQNTDSQEIVSSRQAMVRLAAALRECKENKPLQPFWRDVYNWLCCHESQRTQNALAGIFVQADDETLSKELARKLYVKNKKIRGSVTRLESFSACPFKHFAQYGLRLRERREFNFGRPDLGTLLHSVMCKYGERLKAEKRKWQDVTAEEQKKICQEITAEIAPKLQNEILLSSAQYKNLLQRIEKIAEKSIQRLSEMAAVSKFSPVAFECSFGPPPAVLPPLEYTLSEDTKLELTGQIDRIDCNESGDYLLVVDYKTGRAGINLLEVFYGLKLQLLTYLLVALNAYHSKGKNILPAGMLYCFLKKVIVGTKRRLTPGEAEKEIRKELRMPGWILADPEVIRELDNTFSFIKVGLTGNNEIRKNQAASVKTAEEFELLLEYTDYILTRLGRKIAGGEIKASPYQMNKNVPCGYCQYRDICGFDTKIPGYEYREFVKEQAEIMQEMKQAAEGEKINGLD